MFWSLFSVQNGRYFLVPLLLCLGISYNSASAEFTETIFAPQSGTPTSISNFVEIEAGCNWSGIGGQVFNQLGTPVTGIVVKIWGSYSGNQILSYGVSGGSADFGPGGFLFKLGDHASASSETMRLQVLDLAGNELSPPIKFNTYADCSRNLVLLKYSRIFDRKSNFSAFDPPIVRHQRK